MPQTHEASSYAILDHIMQEWQGLQPLGGVPPPRGLWILAHEPVPPDSVHNIETPIARAWFGNGDGLHEREADVVERLRANVAAWDGAPYFRWGWVDFALLTTEPVYYVTCLWGGRYGYGLQAAVTASGMVLTSAHLWRA